ncbi:hypothetical protein [uncultured Rikenella sp.]|uniref:hypothetical protein n=1 Tax=uncultured Rikenella sp. TaxID=368003 RepID=UPI002632770B|nr:hypothetical protein [uncultured Rikenella sp.]
MTHQTHRDDRSRLVVIKRYTNPEEAWLDADLLRSRGIECEVDGATGGGVLPFIQGQVSLIVPRTMASEAVRIVPGAAWQEED